MGQGGLTYALPGASLVLALTLTLENNRAAADSAPAWQAGQGR